MKRVFVGMCLLLLCWVPTASALNREEALHLFVKADWEYKQGKFAESAALYEQIVNGGWESGPTYFNLGNSYFKQGSFGKAILNYEKARRLIPRDEDLRANWRFAVSQLKGPILSAEGGMRHRLVEVFRGNLTQPEMQWFILLLLIFLVVGHLSGLYRPRWLKAGRSLMVVVGFIGMFFIFALILVSNAEKDQAVVLVDTGAKFEPRAQATTYFDLFAGQSVRVLKREDLWFKVERVDGKIGWVAQDKLEKI